ncbi:MAG: homoprotocatechuate degradation operon regulator HpaR [Rhodospirillum sp.]|nr:homoprotocatechuate degradation operon regulator HpaR [Rhodospirillum sp.]MCF8500580.1 homoprotocatechuate degradation operon regulator HpaR [Rhodospirillum sp.]
MDERDERGFRLPETGPIAYGNLPLLLARSREAVISHFRPLLKHIGLTEQQWRIIRVLVERGGMEQRLLAETCHILGPSLAGILNRMEEMGLIARCKVPTDQRRVVVSVTDKSRALVTEMAPLVETQYRYLEDAMGREFIESLFAHLHQLLAFQDQPIRHVDLPESLKPVRREGEG